MSPKDVEEFEPEAKKNKLPFHPKSDYVKPFKNTTRKESFF